MGKYVIKRLLLLIPTMLLVCVIVFALMRAVPGSAVDQVVYNYKQNGMVITYEEAEAKLGLDKPAVVQFFSWIGGILRGDLGDCLFRSDSVWDVISAQMPVTLELIRTALRMSSSARWPWCWPVCRCSGSALWCWSIRLSGGASPFR